ALDRQANVLAEIASGLHPFARGLVQGAHLVIGMREDDPALVRRRLPLAIPTVNQIAARLLACCGVMHHATGVIGMDRRGGPATRQIARGVALPVLSLAAHFPDIDAAMTLMDGAEGRPGLDGLQLLRI